MIVKTIKILEEKGNGSLEMTSTQKEQRKQTDWTLSKLKMCFKGHYQGSGRKYFQTYI